MNIFLSSKNGGASLLGDARLIGQIWYINPVNCSVVAYWN